MPGLPDRRYMHNSSCYRSGRRLSIPLRGRRRGIGHAATATAAATASSAAAAAAAAIITTTVCAATAAAVAHAVGTFAAGALLGLPPAVHSAARPPPRHRPCCHHRRHRRRHRRRRRRRPPSAVHSAAPPSAARPTSSSSEYSNAGTPSAAARRCDRSHTPTGSPRLSCSQFLGKRLCSPINSRSAASMRRQRCSRLCSGRAQAMGTKHLAENRARPGTQQLFSPRPLLHGPSFTSGRPFVAEKTMSKRWRRSEIAPRTLAKGSKRARFAHQALTRSARGSAMRLCVKRTHDVSTAAFGHRRLAAQRELLQYHRRAQPCC